MTPAPQRKLSLRAVVVGGSLVGLSMGVALARQGAVVTVLERTPHAGYEGGGGLGVDVDLLHLVTGLAGSPPVCQGIDRATTAWTLLAAWLEAQALKVPAVEVLRGAEVVDVGDGWAVTADGYRAEADLVIGADGARSIVRAFVSPDRPDAVYAGFVLWRAMVAEADLPAAIPWLRPDEPSREYYSGPYRLVTYPVPGADGSSQPGRRRLNLVWYDPARSDLLADLGLLDGDTVSGIADPGRRARTAPRGAGERGQPAVADTVARGARDRRGALPGLRYPGRPVPARPTGPRPGGAGRRRCPCRFAHGRGWLPPGPVRRGRTGGPACGATAGCR